MKYPYPLALVAAFVWPVLATALSFGQIVAATQPGAAPQAVAPPTVAVGAANTAAVAPVPADARIAVLPFTPNNPQAGNEWIGKSIQQSLSADLLKAAPGRVRTADTAANTSADAAAAGRQLGADYVVFGTYTSADASLRIIGQVVDCSTGNAVTALKVTGKLGDVFVLEDNLSRQASTALLSQTAAPAGPDYTVREVPDDNTFSQTYYPPNGAATPPQSSTGYAYPPPSTADQQYQQTYVTQPSSVYYSYPVYSYPYYSYPYYAYPYSYGYPSIYLGFGYYGGRYCYGGRYYCGSGYYGGGYHGGSVYVGGSFHSGGGGGGFHGGGGHR